MRLRNERGSVAIMTATSLLVLVSAVALAVDTGNSHSHKRTVSGWADLISLDTARAVGDRYDATQDTQAQAEEYAAEAATRNGFDLSVPTNTMTVELGVMDWNANTFTTPPPGGAAAANAVRVVLGATVEHGFLPGETAFTSEAIAAIDAQAGVKVGSSLANFDPSASPFDPVLGSMAGVSFDANGYDALVNASVALGDLWLQLGLGSSDQVANSTVTMGQLFDASIAALNNKGDAASVAAANQLSSQRAAVKGGTSFTFGQWLALSGSSPNEAAGLDVNILDLLAASASVANGSNLINVTLPVMIPGVSSVTMKMGVVEKPVTAIGPARQDASGNWKTIARSAQTRMQFTLDVIKDLTVLGVPVNVTLPIYLEAGRASAELRGIDCLTPFSTSPVDVRAQTAASTGAVGVVNDASLTGGSVTIGEAQIAYDPLLVDVRASGTHTIAGSTHDFTFTGPFDQPPTPGTRPKQRAGSTNPSLDALAASVTVTATPAPAVAALVNAVTIANNAKNIIKPVIEVLDDTLLPALASMPMGFTWGGADVTNTSLDCTIRRLAG